MKNKEKLGVCGIGYVGFPVAMLFADSGMDVIGFDIDQERVDALNKGENPIEGKEPGLSQLVRKVRKSGRFEATADPKRYSEVDYIIVAVQTPVGSEDKKPTYSALKSALRDIGRNMKKGAIVIVESTVAPKTMEKVVKKVLEKESGLVEGKGFHIANCPERLMPGRLIENITYYNRVVGSNSPTVANKVIKLYKRIVKGDIRKTDWVTAEVVKTGENTYRDIQIAFANEMALLCESLGANVWDVRELINDCKKITETRPEALRQMHYPGAGVGGHCIPKDSWLLITNAKGAKAKIIPTARDINDFMPKHMYKLLKDGLKEAGVKRRKPKVLVLGYAYDANSDDDRNTPTEPFLKQLKRAGVRYKVHDPYISEYKGDLEKMISGIDAVVLFAAHDQYKRLKLVKLKSLMRSKPILVDGRNVFNKEKSRKAGFIYKGVGNV